MNPSLSWLDPDAVAASLRRLAPPSGEPSSPQVRTTVFSSVDQPPKLVLDEGPLRRRGAAPAGASSPAASRDSAQASPGLGGGVVAETFRAEGGSLKDRLDSYLTWTLDRTRSSSAFVIDAEGLVLAERESDGELVAIASSLAHQLQRLRTSLEEHALGTFAVDLDRANVLHLAEVEGELGRFAVGFVSDQEVPGPTRKLLQQGLSQVMAE